VESVNTGTRVRKSVCVTMVQVALRMGARENAMNALVFVTHNAAVMQTVRIVTAVLTAVVNLIVQVMKVVVKPVKFVAMTVRVRCPVMKNKLILVLRA